MASLIERNGSNLLRLINQILDLSKVEAGQMRLRSETVDIVGFTRYVVESFHSMASQKGITLFVSSDLTACQTSVDKDKLQDMLANLLNNALKFTPAGGEVMCHLQMITGQSSPRLAGFHEEVIPSAISSGGHWLQIRVRDTGPGIDAESLPRIFDRFYQRTDDSAAGKTIWQAGGTGIGLAFVRELVTLMGGGLAVSSQPGAGSEFVLTLPIAAPPLADALGLPIPSIIHKPTESTTNSPAQPTASPTEGDVPANQENLLPLLLLVEDNDDVAAYIQSCVDMNFRVIRAENGQVGIDKAFAFMPDLIVSDVMMPLKDGFELCETLKNDIRTSHIPLVLLTARAAVSDRLTGLRRGADAYLVKPFAREELRSVLQNLLQARQRLQRYYTQRALGNTPALAPIGDAQAVPASSPTETPTDLTEDVFIQRLRVLVESRLDDSTLDVETICQSMGLSRTSLHSKLTALTGMSVNRYLRALRLQRAQKLLSDSALNVSEVAYAVGFDDPKYFSRVFSEEFGVSPGQFRQAGPS
ncbi:hybrid sensor histidine kinase/response regulator transcription factor [Rudanella paleaurantiibacter]|uniref:hybrid sensor histidine kinase/response regulator transcription factor n=1 Tax=Rudanella paleaurantiibacter TaxID=2614655 RepID=UPI001FE425FB|nr:ATP-binding protein [Rudanella paleaurantiibacter]